MVKVNRRIGAIAIYSPLRAGALVLGAVVTVGAGGFGLARFIDEEGDAAAQTPAKVAPQAANGPTPGETEQRKRADAAEARVERVLDRLGQVRARNRRLQRRIITANQSESRLRGGTPYVVTMLPGFDGADFVITGRHRIKSGETYRTCSDGKGVCIVRNGG